MSIYAVYAEVTISLSAVVEADSEAEAIEKAESLNLPTICYSCSQRGYEAWGMYKIDGEPTNISAFEES
jgi:hypothetical protein